MSIKVNSLIFSRSFFPRSSLQKHILFPRIAPISSSKTYSFTVFKRNLVTHIANPNDNTINCTVIDDTGNIRSMSKRFNKMDFLKSCNLYPRDLRKIDNTSIDIIPSIAVRKNCILVNLLHIKSIIKKDEIFIFDSSDLSSIKKLSLFIYDLQDKLKINMHQNISFEFKVLESILINVLLVLENDLNQHSSEIKQILKGLENEIDRRKLRDLLIHSKSISDFYQRSTLIRDVLDDLLDNDDDLRGMYLSKNSNNILHCNDGTRHQLANIIANNTPSVPVITSKHASTVNEYSSNSNITKKSDTKETKSDTDDNDTDEIEFLVENYYKQCDEFVQQASSLISDIKSTEQIVNIILDSNRNSLMLYDLKITIYTLGFTVATTIPAFYGMNLKNFIEESNYGLVGIVSISVLLAIFITKLSFSKLRNVQRKTMMIHPLFKNEDISSNLIVPKNVKKASNNLYGINSTGNANAKSPGKQILSPSSSTLGSSFSIKSLKNKFYDTTGLGVSGNLVYNTEKLHNQLPRPSETNNGWINFYLKTKGQTTEILDKIKLFNVKKSKRLPKGNLNNKRNRINNLKSWRWLTNNRQEKP